VADYKIKIDRAPRFRNGLSHGEAAVLEVAATIRLLVNRQARLTARTGPTKPSWRVNRSRDSFDKDPVDGKQWRRQIPAAMAISDALFDQTKH
jgi:hypothetical protein